MPLAPLGLQGGMGETCVPGKTLSRGVLLWGAASPNTNILWTGSGGPDAFRRIWRRNPAAGDPAASGGAGVAQWRPSVEQRQGGEDRWIELEGDYALGQGPGVRQLEEVVWEPEIPGRPIRHPVVDKSFGDPPEHNRERPSGDLPDVRCVVLHAGFGAHIVRPPVHSELHDVGVVL